MSSVRTALWNLCTYEPHAEWLLPLSWLVTAPVRSPVIINDSKQEALEIVEQAKKEAERIKEEYENNIEELKKNSQEILDAYLEASEPVVKAEEKANEMISRAELLAKEIRLGSIEYAEDVLTTVEHNLKSILQEIERNRIELNPGK